MALLVSVASIPEIEDAVRGGAQILDAKDPDRGSLGLADPGVVSACRRRAPPELPVSAALGDRIAAVPGGPAGLAALAVRLARRGASVLKVGLAGVAPRRAVRELIELRGRLDAAGVPGVRLVAVAFADAAAPEGVLARELPSVARRAGADAAMLDTLRKPRSLLALLPEPELAAWIDDVHAHGLLCGVAGSLAIEDAGRARAMGADVVGLRGAVCVGGRSGRVAAARVAAARTVLDASSEVRARLPAAFAQRAARPA